MSREIEKRGWPLFSAARIGHVRDYKGEAFAGLKRNFFDVLDISTSARFHPDEPESTRGAAPGLRMLRILGLHFEKGGRKLSNRFATALFRLRHVFFRPSRRHAGRSCLRASCCRARPSLRPSGAVRDPESRTAASCACRRRSSSPRRSLRRSPPRGRPR